MSNSNMKYKVGDRVTFPDMPFLSDGYVMGVFPNFGYAIKLDKKAPNEYAWDTDEILAFPNDIELEIKGE